LAAKGVEILKGDANDAASIKAAVQGADVVFGNTAFSDAIGNPASADLKYLKPGQTIREMSYELELQQGKNIADAVASVGGLEKYIWSSLSDATKWSKGKYKGVYHFDCKAHVVDYINETYPELAKKLSILQMGLFITNWKWGQASIPWEKVRKSLTSLLLNADFNSVRTALCYFECLVAEMFQFLLSTPRTPEPTYGL